MRPFIISLKGRITLAATTIILALVASTAKAYDFSANGIYYNIVGTARAEVTFANDTYNSYSGQVVIPDAVTYNNHSYNVTAVGENAFRNSNGLKTVTLNNNVTKIGKRAFLNCTQLTKVNITSAVIHIDDYAFAQCSSLNEVTFNNDAPIELGTGAFMKCSQLNNVNWTSCLSLDGRGGLSIIGTNAFAQCSALESIYLPGDFQLMGSTIFDKCNNLSSITLAMENPLPLNGDPFALQASNVTIYVPSSGTQGETAALYENAVGWREYNIVELPYSFIDDKQYTYLKNPDGTLTLTGCDDTNREDITVRNAITDFGGNIFNVTSIADEAFKWTSIITFDTSNAKKLKSIGAEAFANCTLLTNVILREGISLMGTRVFANCSALKTVKVPSTLRTIPEGAFEDCSSLDNVKLVNGVANISQYAFNRCSSLKTITLPSSTALVEPHAFKNATSLQNITVNSRCQNYASCDGALFERKYGEEFAPEEIGKMNKLIIYPMGKTNESYYIPSGVTIINQDAFEGATHLKNLSVPSTTTLFGDDCFKGTNIESLNYRNTDPSNDGTAGITPSLKSNATLKVPVGTIPKYTALTAWQGFKNIVECDEAFHDSNFAFDWNDNHEVTIVDIYPAAVTSSGTLTIPSTVTFSGYEYYITIIRNNSTQKVAQLAKNLIINADSLKVIDTSDDLNPLAALQKLEHISITKSNLNLKVVDNMVLNYHSNILYYYLISDPRQHVIIPNTIDIIMPQTFAHNPHMTHISFNSKISKVGACAFEECGALQLVDNAKNITTIERRAFANCSALTTFSGGEQMNEIDEEAFINCDKLTHFPFAHGMLRAIGKRAFKNCSSLGTSVMSLNLTDIGDEAFENCYSLDKMFFTIDADNWGERVFKGCSSLNELWVCNVLPPSVDNDFFNQSGYLTAQLYVPKSGLNNYQNTSPWNKAATINSSSYLYDGPDVNGDGYINALDITLVMSVLLGDFNDGVVGHFDVNHDGAINAVDLTVIYNYILEGSSSDLDMAYKFVKNNGGNIESIIKLGSEIKVKSLSFINPYHTEYISTGLLGYIDNTSVATITQGIDSDGAAYLKIVPKKTGYCTLVAIVNDGTTCHYRTFPLTVVN